MDITFRIRKVANEHGIQTAEELWAKIGGGVSISTIQKHWGNRIKHPDYTTLRAIAQAIGVNVQELEEPKQ